MNKLVILRESMIFIKYYAIVTPILALVVVIEWNPSFLDTFWFDFHFFFSNRHCFIYFQKVVPSLQSEHAFYLDRMYPWWALRELADVIARPLNYLWKFMGVKGGSWRLEDFYLQEGQERRSMELQAGQPHPDPLGMG